MKVRREALARAMKRRALARMCPKCGRGAAMRRVKDARGMVVAAICRWCKHEEPRGQ